MRLSGAAGSLIGWRGRCGNRSVATSFCARTCVSIPTLYILLWGIEFRDSRKYGTQTRCRGTGRAGLAVSAPACETTDTSRELSVFSWRLCVMSRGARRLDQEPPISRNVHKGQKSRRTLVNSEHRSIYHSTTLSPNLQHDEKHVHHSDPTTRRGPPLDNSIL